MYNFDGKSFNSKKSVDNYIRGKKKQILESNCGLIKPDNEYFSFLYEIVNNHKNKEEKIGTGISYFYFVVDSFMTDQLRIQRTDGTDVQCSCVYSKIILSSTHNAQSNKLNTALRNAIRDQILAYKNLMNDLKCVYCKSVENCEIDHIIPFSILCNGFFDTIDKSQIPTKFYKDIQRSCSLYFLEKDIDFEKRWKEYHQSKATFQVLCKTCNQKKGGQYIQDV